MSHGMSKTRTYFAWKAVRQRCTNPKHKAWDRYGGRGITVCDRWRQFENFYADMGEAPDGHSLERIDNEKGYEPGNCKWATSAEQANNRRSNVRLTYGGRTQTATEWASELGIKPSTLRKRLSRGYTLEQCFAPLHQGKRNES